MRNSINTHSDNEPVLVMESINFTPKYNASLGSIDRGWFLEDFKNLDDLRDWAHRMIKEYNLSDVTLKIYRVGEQNPGRIIEIK